jgi:hypothetical protein
MGERLYFGSRFQIHDLLAPVPFGPMARQHIMAGYMVEEAVHLMATRQRGRDWDPSIPLRVMPPVT